MPAELIKLVIVAENTVTGEVQTTTETEVRPDALKFVANVTADMVTGGQTVIPATSFTDDNGDPITTLPVTTATNYYNVYINAVLQQQELSVITAANVTISAEILVGAPVVLELVDLSDTTSTSTSTNNLDVTTIINT
ncbi:DUF4183 domain-containing protein [Bacillus sp. CGMCC 1.16541]|uniref:DUF4183 domain-containing protein n=1 Tax=Bacillus sp. CGMCC 1.16541 TaxID=2185143 RepID=UPI0013A59EC8|nr:DUF4183 domain-containing protein [Bacillus sp. CGMCC 1.16541]